MTVPGKEMPARGDIVALIADILERRGAESYLGEAVTMSEHMLQCAWLAEQAGADGELIVAALLHDIGHYTSEFPADMVGAGVDNRHERAGALLLQPYFPPRVTVCVREHVAAKRYLCAVDPAYHDRLSQASKDTLRLQGGPMSPAEAEAFATNPELEAVIQVRLWDDDGKVAGRATPPFDHYAPIMQRLLDRGPEASSD